MTTTPYAQSAKLIHVNVKKIDFLFKTRYTLKRENKVFYYVNKIARIKYRLEGKRTIIRCIH